MGVLAKGRPALSFGVASARFGFVTVCVMAAGAGLLTWLPQSDAYKPITYPVQAIADSVPTAPRVIAIPYASYVKAWREL